MIVSDAAEEAGVGGFGFFEFALVGVPLLAGVIAIVGAASASGCCPTRQPRSIPPDFSEHARTLVAQYELDHARGRADDAPLGRGRGRDPAALGARRRHGVPGHDHRRAATSSILAVQRQGEDTGPGETVLAEGDTLLLQGTWAALDANLDDPDVLVVDPPELVRRQAVPLGRGREARRWWCWRAWWSLLATGVVPPAVAGLVAASAMILLGVLTVEQA